jgi:hypothetical protein
MPASICRSGAAAIGVFVGVTVGVLDGVDVGVTVGVLLGVGVGVAQKNAVVGVALSVVVLSPSWPYVF